MVVRSHNKAFGRGTHDPKLKLLRRADTERDTIHSLTSQDKSRSALVEKKPITLPRLKFLEKPFEEDD